MKRQKTGWMPVSYATEKRGRTEIAAGQPPVFSSIRSRGGSRHPLSDHGMSSGQIHFLYTVRSCTNFGAARRLGMYLIRPLVTWVRREQNAATKDARFGGYFHSDVQVHTVPPCIQSQVQLQLRVGLRLQTARCFDFTTPRGEQPSLVPQLSRQGMQLVPDLQVSATYTTCAQPSRFYLPFDMIYDSNSLAVAMTFFVLGLWFGAS
jgi:hypothetical protein